MQISNNPKSLRVDGKPALLTILASSSPLDGGEETDALLTVERPEGLIYMVFIAPAQEYRNLQDVFNNIMRSVRFRS